MLLLRVGALVLGVLEPAATVVSAVLFTGAGPHLLKGHRMLQLYVLLVLLKFSESAYEAKKAPNPSQVLGVFGLSIRTQERDLDEEFSRFGRVEKVTIVYDQRVRQSGFPYFLTLTHATCFLVRSFSWFRLYQDVQHRRGCTMHYRTKRNCAYISSVHVPSTHLLHRN